jgi:hypothetical protein
MREGKIEEAVLHRRNPQGSRDCWQAHRGVALLHFQPEAVGRRAASSCMDGVGSKIDVLAVRCPLWRRLLPDCKQNSTVEFKFTA